MKPSAQFRQHHNVAEPRIDGRVFHPAWRVVTRLDGLLDDHSISTMEWRAAVAFRNDVETSLIGIWRSSLAMPIAVSGSQYGAGVVIRLDVLGRLQVVRRALGAFAYDLLEACAVRDLSWAALGRQLDVDAKTARAWTVVAIKALSGGSR